MMTFSVNAVHCSLAIIACWSLLFAPRCRADDDFILSRIEALQDKKNSQRARAAFDLMMQGSKATTAIPALIAALDDDDLEVCDNAARALGQIGQAAVQPLIDALPKASDKTAIGAAEALRVIGKEAKPAIPTLIKTLDRDSAEVRIAATYALGAMSEPGVTKALTQRLRTDPDFGVRRAAATALGTLGADAEAAIPVLVQTLREMHELSRREEPLDVPNTSAHRFYIAWINLDAVPGLQLEAGLALQNIYLKMGEAAVPGLVALLKDPEQGIREDALRFLGCIGPHAKDAVPAVIPLLQDKAPTTRSRAVSALCGVGPRAAPALPALRKLYDDPFGDLRVRAAGTVLAIKSPDEDALKVLLSGLNDRDASTRRLALETIGWLGLCSEKVITALGVACAADKDQGVRAFAVGCLGKLAPSIPTAIPHLVGCLGDESEEVRKAALVEFLFVRNEKRAVPGLIRNLRDPDGRLRILAARALAAQGVEAASAIAALEQAAKDDGNADVRKAANRALSTIREAQKAAWGK